MSPVDNSISAIPVHFWNHRTVREVERASIRKFVEANKQYLTGRVFDFGSGKEGTCAVPEPYRDLVKGSYYPFEQGESLPTCPSFDTVLCTQVLQYLPYPQDALRMFRDQMLVAGGVLLLTYPTNWDEVEATDLWRFTKAGVERMLRVVGFKIIKHERRAEIDLGGFKLALGYGVVCSR